MVRRLAKRLDSLLRAEHGDDVAGRFIALEQLWLHDEVMRLVAFFPRLAGPAAELLGEPAIRIYHDNALSKEPGCGRTPWHHDAEHFPLATLQAVTAWIPVTAIPAYMGPLALARGAHVRDMVADLSFDKVGTTYDAAVARRFVESDVAVDASPFAVGEVSFHSALCLHAVAVGVAGWLAGLPAVATGLGAWSAFAVIFSTGLHITYGKTDTSTRDFARRGPASG